MLEIGHLIYLKRVGKKLTQEELALRAGIPQPNLSNIEKGKQDVTVSTLIKIAHALETDMRDFFEGSDLPAETRGKEGKVSRPPLSRRRIEKLARAVSGKMVAGLPEEDKEIVRLIQEILPTFRKKSGGMKAKEAAWAKLRRLMSLSEIQVLAERAREKMRISSG